MKTLIFLCCLVTTLAQAATPLEEMVGLASAQAGRAVALSGYNTDADGGGGMFSIIADDGRATNSGTVFRSTVRTNLLFVRQDATPLNVKWFGATDDATDDATAIQAAFTAAQNGQEIFFPNGTFLISTNIVLQNKTNVTVRGPGAILMSGTLGGGASLGVQMAGVLQDVTFDRLTIKGDGDTNSAHAGIFSYSGATLKRVRVQNCRIQDVNVGISLNGNLSGTVEDCWVVNNHLEDIQGTASGTGYGIHVAVLNGDANGIHVIGNTVRNAQRHSIYHGRGRGNEIIGNIILDHREGISELVGVQAIVVSRSQNMLIANNLIQNFADGAMLLWGDSTANATNFIVTGNSFVNPANAFPILTFGSEGPSLPTEGQVYSMTINGNQFYTEESGDAIRGWAGKNIVIDGNTFISAKQTTNNTVAISLRGQDETAGTTNYTDYVWIKGNIFQNWCSSNYFIGLYCLTNICASEAHVISQGNTFGLRVYPGATEVTNVVNPNIIWDRTLYQQGAIPSIIVQDSDTASASAKAWVVMGESNEYGRLDANWAIGYNGQNLDLTNSFASATVARFNPSGWLSVGGTNDWIYPYGSYLLHSNATQTVYIGARNSDGHYGGVGINPDGSTRMVSSLNPLYFSPAGTIMAKVGTDIFYYGAAGEFQISSAGAVKGASFSGGTVTATNGLYLGSMTADPVSPSNGQVWYNSTAHEYRGWRNGAAFTFNDPNFDEATIGTANIGEATFTGPISAPTIVLDGESKASWWLNITNRLWVHQTNNIIYLSAPWPEGRWEFGIKLTNTALATGLPVFSGLNLRTDTNPMHHDGGVYIAGLLDDFPPINTSWGYVSGSHGWELRKVTWAAHSADVGDYLKDALAAEFCVTEIVDENSFFIAPNRADVISVSPASGNLTNVTKDVYVSAGSWSAANTSHFPCWSSVDTQSLVDGTTLLNNALMEARQYKLVSRQTIFDPRTAYALALGNASFTYADCLPLLYRTLTHTVDGNMTLSVDDTLVSVSATNWTLGFSGAAQLGVADETSTYYWLPNSKPVGGVDLSSPSAASTISASTTYGNTAESAVDLNVGLNAFWKFDGVTVGATTNFTCGSVLVYDPDYFDSATRLTDGSTWYFYLNTKKVYPKSLVSRTMTNGYTGRLRAYRKWFPSSGTFYTNAIIYRQNDTLVVTNAYITKK